METIIFVVVFSLVGLIMIPYYTTHVWLSKKYSNEKDFPFDVINFVKFKKLFELTYWQEPSEYKRSYFGKGDANLGFDPFVENYVHAGIVCIDGKCYFFDPISFIIFHIWGLKRRENSIAMELMNL